MPREPLRSTLARTVWLAVVGGAPLALAWGGLGRWPVATAVLLWPTFGGHWIEVWFLDWLRPRLPDNRGQRIAARLATWFVGGAVLGQAMALTAITFAPLSASAMGHYGRISQLPWWSAALAFVALELVLHLLLQVFGRPSFYNGRG